MVVKRFPGRVCIFYVELFWSLFIWLFFRVYCSKMCFKFDFSCEFLMSTLNVVWSLLPGVREKFRFFLFTEFVLPKVDFIPRRVCGELSFCCSNREAKAVKVYDVFCCLILFSLGSGLRLSECSDLVFWQITSIAFSFFKEEVDLLLQLFNLSVSMIGWLLTRWRVFIMIVVRSLHCWCIWYLLVVWVCC